MLDMNEFKNILKERYEEEVVPMEWPSTEETNFLCKTQVYDILRKFGLQYGPKFQNITKLVSGSGRALAELQGIFMISIFFFSFHLIFRRKHFFQRKQKMIDIFH